MSNDWRRQKVEDHKFDFIDVDDYVDNSLWRKFKYSLVFAIVIKGILIYCADLWTAVNLLISGTWQTNLGVQDGQISFKDINISFEIYKWIFAACIILSFVLLAWDMKKAAAIIKSRDISYAFTSMIAYRYYAIKSYAHFCLFQRIHNSKKTIDEIAFFCFFTFRGWKRLMFADGPRQVINGIILITVLNKNSTKTDMNFAFWNYPFPIMTRVTMGLMTFTLTLWIISVLLMLVAVALYIPLVIRIQGNLKEFCCHKIDKRIDEIVKKKVKQHALEAAKNAKTGKGGETPLQKPTLPKIDFMDAAPVPSSTPRMAAAQSPYKAPGSPASRNNVLAPVDPYRRQNPPPPPRSYSPGPRSYTPAFDDDNDNRPLRQDNYQQAYHNRSLQRQDQRFDFADDRSEVSDGAYSLNGGYMAPQFGIGAQNQGHSRQPSETSTVLSGYGPRPGRAHPLQQGHVPNYNGSPMMTEVGNRVPPVQYGVYQMQPTVGTPSAPYRPYQ
ncbi:hypothetical protein BGZ98_008737 [Dissophora globulifera]|nr:hypothetical protein BGZ98_008737 [Dissophora globulifera]